MKKWLSILANTILASSLSQKLIACKKEVKEKENNNNEAKNIDNKKEASISNQDHKNKENNQETNPIKIKKTNKEFLEIENDHVDEKIIKKTKTKKKKVEKEPLKFDLTHLNLNCENILQINSENNNLQININLLYQKLKTKIITQYNSFFENNSNLELNLNNFEENGNWDLKVYANNNFEENSPSYLSLNNSNWSNLKNYNPLFNFNDHETNSLNVWIRANDLNLIQNNKLVVIKSYLNQFVYNTRLINNNNNMETNLNRSAKENNLDPSKMVLLNKGFGFENLNQNTSFLEIKNKLSSSNLNSTTTKIQQEILKRINKFYEIKMQYLLNQNLVTKIDLETINQYNIDLNYITPKDIKLFVMPLNHQKNLIEFSSGTLNKTDFNKASLICAFNVSNWKLLQRNNYFGFKNTFLFAYLGQINFI